MNPDASINDGFMILTHASAQQITSLPCCTPTQLQQHIQSGHSDVPKLEIHSSVFEDPDLVTCLNSLTHLKYLRLGTRRALCLADLDLASPSDMWGSLSLDLRKALVSKLNGLTTLSVRGLSEIPIVIFRLCRSLRNLDFEVVDSFGGVDLEIPSIACDPASMNPHIPPVVLRSLRFCLKTSRCVGHFVEGTLRAQHPMVGLSQLKSLVISIKDQETRHIRDVNSLFNRAQHTLEKFEFKPHDSFYSENSARAPPLDLSQCLALRKIKFSLKTCMTVDRRNPFDPFKLFLTPVIQTLASRSRQTGLDLTIEFYFNAFPQSYAPSLLQLNNLMTAFRNWQRNHIVQTLNFQVLALDPESGVRIPQLGAVKTMLEQSVVTTIQPLCIGPVSLRSSERLFPPSVQDSVPRERETVPPQPPARKDNNNASQVSFSITREMMENSEKQMEELVMRPWEARRAEEERRAEAQRPANTSRQPQPQSQSQPQPRSQATQIYPPLQTNEEPQSGALYRALVAATLAQEAAGGPHGSSSHRHGRRSRHRSSAQHGYGARLDNPPYPSVQPTIGLEPVTVIVGRTPTGAPIYSYHQYPQPQEYQPQYPDPPAPPANVAPYPYADGPDIPLSQAPTFGASRSSTRHGNAQYPDTNTRPRSSRRRHQRYAYMNDSPPSIYTSDSIEPQSGSRSRHGRRSTSHHHTGRRSRSNHHTRDVPNGHDGRRCSIQ